MECERTLPGWKPRRLGLLHSNALMYSLDGYTGNLGGGFGGKKESGQLRFGGKDRPFRKPMYESCGSMKINVFMFISCRVLGKNYLQRGRQDESFYRGEGFYRGHEHFRHDKQWKPHNYNHRHRSRSRSR